MATYVVSMGLAFTDATEPQNAQIAFAKNVWPSHGLWDDFVATYASESQLVGALNGKVITDLQNTTYSPLIGGAGQNVKAPIGSNVWLPGPNGAHEVVGQQMEYVDDTDITFSYPGSSSTLQALVVFWATWRECPCVLS